MKFFLLVFLSLLLSTSGFAQKRTKYSPRKHYSFEMGVFGGISYYNGDLNPTIVFGRDFMRPAYGLVIRKALNMRYSLKGNLIFSRLVGDDSKIDSDFHRNRNLSFESTIWEASGQIEFNFMPFHPRDREKKGGMWTPYVFCGLSVFRFNPTTTLQGNTYNLHPLQTEGTNYNRTHPSFPFGTGVKVKINDRFLISAEWGARRTWTDYIDDVSTTYPDEGVLTGISADLSDRSFDQAGPGGSNWGTQRGNSKNKDWYTFAGILLTYRIGPRLTDCYFEGPY